MKKLRDDMKEFRPAETSFYDLVTDDLLKKRASKGLEELPVEEQEIIGKAVLDMMAVLKDDMDRPGFWNQDAAIKAMKGKLGDIFEFCNIPEIEDNFASVVTNVMSLAKRRYDEIIDKVEQWNLEK